MRVAGNESDSLCRVLAVLEHVLSIMPAFSRRGIKSGPENADVIMSSVLRRRLDRQSTVMRNGGSRICPLAV